jgi:hypothetical protein
VGRHGLYSGHYSGVFVASENAQNVKTKGKSEAVPTLLLALLALMTSAYSSLGVLRGCTLNLGYLKHQSTTQPNHLVQKTWWRDRKENWKSLLTLRRSRQCFFTHVWSVKVEMNTIYDTEAFMSSVLNNLLCAHCLENIMKNNQYYEDTKLSITKYFKLYKSREAFEEDFSTGKVLSGVIVKMPDSDENLYVCYEEKEKSQFVLPEAL